MDDLNSSLVAFFKEDSTRDTPQLQELIKEGVNLNGPLSLEDGSRPLHIAAAKGNTGVVQTLLDHGAYVDVPDYYGNTPSHYAAREGHIEVLQLLIDKGSNVNLKNDKGVTVLENAVCSEHLDVVRLLISKGANVIDAESVLLLAVKKGNFDITKELLKAGVKIIDNVIQNAVMKGNVELARMLVENGAKIGDNNTYLTDTPAMSVAIKCGAYQMAAMLLENSVVVNNEHHMSMYLSDALRKGQWEIAKLLYEKGAKEHQDSLFDYLNNALREGYVDTAKLIFKMPEMSENVPEFTDSSGESTDDDGEFTCDDEEFTDSIDSYPIKLSSKQPKSNRKPRNGFNDALYNAVDSGNIEIIQLVLDRVTDVNTRGKDKTTPLILAIQKDLIHVVKLLLEKGADLNRFDKMGKTALYYAVIHKDSFDLVEVLFDWGASVDDICTKTKQTPLHLAASMKSVALIQFLLQRKANVNSSDIRGNTPLFKLFDKYNLDQESLTACSTILLEAGANLNASNVKEETPMLNAVKNCSTGALRTFFETCFSIVGHESSSVITPDVLSGMILGGHISLLKVVLNKVADSHIQDLMKLNNITLEEIMDGIKTKSIKVEDKNEISFITLLYAAFVGDLHMADIALQSSLEILNSHYTSESRLSPLQVAIYSCNFEMADFLVSKGASLQVRDKYLLLPMQLAVLLGDTALVRKLFSKTTYNISNVFKIPFLHLAAYHGNIGLFKLIFTKLPDINIRDENMNTILHIAVRVQSYELVNFCLGKGVDINAQNVQGDTAFHTALKILDETKSADFAIAMNLLNQGVDINISNSEGKTALHLATSHNLTSFIGILLERGVWDLNARDNKGCTPFKQMILNIKDEVSVPYDVTDAAVLFLNYGADTDLYVDREHLLMEILLKKEFIRTDDIVLAFFSNWKSLQWTDDYDCPFQAVEEMDIILKHVCFKKKCYLLELALKLGFTFSQEFLNESLFHYIFHKDNYLTDIKILILEKDKTVEVVDSYLFTAMEDADLGIVRVLLEKLCVELTDYSGQSLLQRALQFKNKQTRKFGLAQLFLDRGVSVNPKSADGCVPLIEAASSGHFSMVNILLDKGAIANVRNNCYRTAMHYAAFHGQNEMIQLLLKHGAKVYFGDRSNVTALHVAAEAGNHETVELLLKSGADISVKDNAGDTPLHKTKSSKVAEVLLRNGVSVNAKNNENQTPLHFAAKRSTNCLLLLIRNGAKLDVKDLQGMTPLHHAVQNHKLENVEQLLNHGAQLEVKNARGETALHLCAKNRRTDVLLVLIEKGANLDVEDNFGQNTLNHAFKNDNCQTAKCLLLNGASINSKTLRRHGLSHLYSSRLKSSTDNFLTNYVELLEIAGMSVEENKTLQIVETKKKNGLQELNHMKVSEVNEGFFLIDIFSKFNKPSYLLDDTNVEELNALFKSPDFHQRFPLYADVLRGTVAKAKRSRYFLLRRAARSMMTINRRECCKLTPDLVWEKVCGYLSDKDLTNIIKSED